MIFVGAGDILSNIHTILYASWWIAGLILYAIYNRTIRTESDLMPLQFCSFASGSSGSCYLIKNQRSAILIDAGISGKKIFQGLEETGTPFEAVSGLSSSLTST